MRFLVTGGAGFIGSNLCRRLLLDGHEVVCLDNLCTGRMSNIETLLDLGDFTFVQADVCDPIEVEADAIFNLACPASPPRYQANPVKTTRTCFEGSLNVLELADRLSARVVHASTSEVYGEPEVHPQHEGYRGNVNPIGPRSCYDEGKRVAESLFFDFARTRGTDIGVVRIFNTYGPFMDPEDGRVVSNFIMQALCSRDVTIYGDGSQTRSFCYVDDLVEGLVRMMRAKGESGPINLGNPEEHTVAELAEKVLKSVGGFSRISYHARPEDDPTRRRPDIALAKERLGWSPTVTLSEGIDRTVSYFRNLVQGVRGQ